MADTPEKKPLQAIVLVAGGRGNRAGDGLPKQYRPVAGISIIQRTIEALQRALPGAAIQPVIHPDDSELFESCVTGLENIFAPVNGGTTRQDSVLNGLRALSDVKPAHIYIHDAARPFVTISMVEGLSAALESGADAVVPVVPIADTLVREQAQGREAIDRTGLVAVQTPQAFDYQSILEAHIKLAGKELTDDASVHEAFGGTVVHVQG